MNVGLLMLLNTNHAFAGDTIREEYSDDPYEDLLYDDRYDYYYEDEYEYDGHDGHEGGSEFLQTYSAVS